MSFECPKGIIPLFYDTFNINFFGTFSGFVNWISQKNNTITFWDIQMTRQFSLHNYTIYSVVLFGIDYIKFEEQEMRIIGTL